MNAQESIQLMKEWHDSGMCLEQFVEEKGLEPPLFSKQEYYNFPEGLNGYIIVEIEPKMIAKESFEFHLTWLYHMVKPHTGEKIGAFQEDLVDFLNEHGSND